MMEVNIYRFNSTFYFRIQAIFQPIRYLFRYLCLINILALLLSCGGGGGGDDNKSTPNRPVGTINDIDNLPNSVNEDAAIGTTVGITAKAIDPDGGSVSYRLKDSAQGRFAVEAGTGVVTVAKTLDIRVASSHTITVLATSSDTSTSDKVFTITLEAGAGQAVGSVSDINDMPNTVSQDANIGALVGITARAVDPDGDTVSYRLDESAGGLFAIDQRSGIVTVAKALTGNIQTLLVRASSTDGSFSQARFTVTVTVVEAPLSFHFPLPGLFEGNVIDVSGRVANRSRVKSLQVNVGLTEIIATIDNQGKWRAKQVPLDSLGQKTITARLVEIDGSEFTSQVTLNVVGPLLLGPQVVTLDSGSTRAFIIDKVRNALLEMNLQTGVRQIVSDHTRGIGTAFDQIHDLVSQVANNRIYVVDENRNAVVFVNTDTGDRTLVSRAKSVPSDTDFRGSGDALLKPRGIVVDGARLLVVSSANKKVIAIDPVTGDRQSIITSTTPGLRSVRPIGICLAEHTHQGNVFKVAYITTLNQLVYGVYLDNVKEPTGTAFLVSDSRGFNGRGVGPGFIRLQGIVCDTDRNQLLVADSSLKAIFAVDIDSGDRTLISGENKGQGGLFKNIESLALQSPSTLLVPDRDKSALISVDMNTGDRSIFSVNSPAAANNIGTGELLRGVKFIAFDEASDRVLVTDSISDSVNAINLYNGNRSELSGNNSGSGPGLGNNIQGIVIHKDDHYALVSRFPSSRSNNSILKVNLVTGERSVLSDTYPGINTLFSATPVGMTLDYSQSRVLVADSALQALFSVDLSDGTSTLISRSAREGPKGTGVAMLRANAVALVGNDALVLGKFRDIVRVNVASNGDRNLFFSDNPTSVLYDIAIEHNRNRVLVVDAGLNALRAKQLNSGDMYTVSDSLTGNGSAFFRPIAITADESRDRAFIFDREVNALFVVDLTSGDRVIVSR